MKKQIKLKTSSDLRSHYDFSKGERGKYARLMGNKTNLVLLRPEVAAVFSSAEEVNDELLKIIKQRKASKR
ncbi:MAG: hypothetical protein QM703_02470 [Gemmatales bacterium]